MALLLRWQKIFNLIGILEELIILIVVLLHGYQYILKERLIKQMVYFILASDGYTGWYTQTLPTSEDGFVYVYVGNAWTTTGVGLSLNHPAYEFKDGK